MYGEAQKASPNGRIPANAALTRSTTFDLENEHVLTETASPITQPTEQQRPNKRQRLSEPGLTSTRPAFSRRRALAACQLCRVRKVKCDNQRPACGFCVEREANCDYHDEIGDVSGFDRASLLIVDKLNEVLQLLHNPLQPPTGSPSSAHAVANHGESIEEFSIAAPSHNDELRNQFSPRSLIETELGLHLESTDTAAFVESMEVAAGYRGTAEDILDWPVFGGRYSVSGVEEAIFRPADDEEQDYDAKMPMPTTDSYASTVCDPRRKASRSKPPDEEDVMLHTHAFIANVHTKNPVLDIDRLLAMARHVLAQGFDWDVGTCLVLIVCALGAISTPFTAQSASFSTELSGEWLDHADSITNSQGYEVAEEYYLAAKKRLGLVGSSIIGTQIFFWFGVYEMYTLRPLKAWTSFNRSCITFQTCTRTKPQHYLQRWDLGANLKHQLYWSCLKSEHEMRIEIRLPASGIARLDYSDSFPSPPNRSPGPSPSASEVGWFYYLAEIAGRRILIRTISAFYNMDEKAWLAVPIRTMLRLANELEAQLDNWRKHLPAPVNFPEQGLAPAELSFHLQARHAEIRERIYRPFLYIAVHLPPEHASQALIVRLVEKHTRVCCSLIDQWRTPFRHHGTWLVVRQALSAGVLLLAAALSPIANMGCDVRLRAIQGLTATLKYWEREAPDFKIWRTVLGNIERDVEL